ncbi:hypothetical protein EYF80_050008 [Liparis tanakae]|uniref:Uncharacterized protein n=1 Tax=Liparis tanakae TaxID=230148 RepID=A0A4Z2FF25_9TELE|nr:hypothetical protein EYF80_050008 [Liparis tanakae]
MAVSSLNVEVHRYLYWYGADTCTGMGPVPVLVWDRYLYWYGAGTCTGMGPQNPTGSALSSDRTPRSDRCNAFCCCRATHSLKQRRAANKLRNVDAGLMPSSCSSNGSPYLPS